MKVFQDGIYSNAVVRLMSVLYLEFLIEKLIDWTRPISIYYQPLPIKCVALRGYFICARECSNMNELLEE